MVFEGSSLEEHHRILSGQGGSAVQGPGQPTPSQNSSDCICFLYRHSLSYQTNVWLEIHRKRNFTIRRHTWVRYMLKGLWRCDLTLLSSIFWLISFPLSTRQQPSPCKWRKNKPLQKTRRMSLTNRHSGLVWWSCGWREAMEGDGRGWTKRGEERVSKRENERERG